VSEQAIQQLLDQVVFELGTLRSAKRKFSAQLAPDFRIFDYLRDDEIALSKCFADLLNPNGKHGQGRLYLDSFLKIIGWQSSVKDCKVELEKQANGMRRIDIFLRFDEGLIGIENKPWAEDKKDQLHDYAEYLNRSAIGKGWKLIYLCNEAPPEHSIKSEKRLSLFGNHHFVHLTYDIVVDWLEACAAQSKALVVRVYVEELAKFIRSKIIGEMDMNETTEVTKVMLATDQNLEASFDIIKSINALKEDLMSRFKNQLIAALKNETTISIDQALNWNVAGDSWWNVSSASAYTGFTIWLDTAKFKRVALRFSFEKKNYLSFFWGVTSYAAKRPEPSKEISEAIFELLKPHFQFGEPRPNDWWTCWAWPSSNAIWKKNWNSKHSPWIAIKNNKLAFEIIAFAKQIQHLLDSNASAA
jgi:hypothetical protein